MKVVLRTFDWVERAFFELGKIILALMMLLITADAVGRYFVNQPITGARQIVSELFMVILVYFCLSFIFRQDGHIKLTLVYNSLPATFQRVLTLIFDLMALAFWGGIGYQYLLRTINSSRMMFLSRIGFEIPTFFPYLIVFLGTLLLSGRLLIEVISEGRWLLNPTSESDKSHA